MNLFRKLFDSYKKLSAAKKASIWFLIISFVNKGSSFILTPFFTRLLSTEGYGVVSVYTSWLTILTPIITLNIASSGYNKSLLDHEDDVDAYTASALLLDLFSIVLFFCIFLVFQDYFVAISKLPFWLLCYMFVYIFMTQATNLWLMQQRFKYKYIASSILTLLISIVGPAIAIVLLKAAVFENEVAVRVLAAGSFSLIIGLFLLFLIFYKSKMKIKVSFWKEALILSLPLIPHTLSMSVLSGSDKIMISNYIDNTAAAKYALSHSIAGIVGTIWTAIDVSFTPWTMKNYKNGNFKRINDYSIKLLIVYCLICFVPICVAPECLLIMGPSQYQDAVWCLLPTLLGIMYIAFYSIYVNVEYAVGKTYLVAIGSCLAALINIGLNMIFIPLFGYVAAAYTTLVSYFALGLFHSLVLRFFFKQRIFNDFIIFAFMIGITAVGLLFQFTYNSYIVRYIILIIVFAIAIVLRKKIIALMRLNSNNVGSGQNTNIK